MSDAWCTMHKFSCNITTRSHWCRPFSMQFIHLDLFYRNCIRSTHTHICSHTRSYKLQTDSQNNCVKIRGHSNIKLFRSISFYFIHLFFVLFFFCCCFHFIFQIGWTLNVWYRDCVVKRCIHWIAWNIFGILWWHCILHNISSINDDNNNFLIHIWWPKSK